MAHESRKIDWTLAAIGLADRTAAATMLLDADGRLWMVNFAMEELTGRRRDDLVGRLWTDELVPVARRDAAGRRIQSACSDEPTRCESPFLFADGTSGSVTFELVPVTASASGGHLATVVAVKRGTVQEERGVVDLRYEISGSADDFGRIHRLRSSGQPAVSRTMEGERCYEAIHRRREPCAGCPALELAGGNRRTGVVVSGWHDAPFAVVAAERNGSERREITAWFISSSVVSGLVRARLRAISEAGGLTEREREVLNLLLLGRSYREIGGVLGIGERTVKYHQSRILEKLGADSRLGLMRLFF
jgi:PAS domain S-box-containing protein